MASVDTAQDRSAGDSPWPNANYAWFVVFALAFTNMVSYLERQILTLMFGPIKADFKLSDTEVSLLAGFAFALCYIGFGLVIGRLADRANRKHIIMIGIVFWSIATMACGLARNFWQLFAARVSVGIGEASLGPSAYSIMSDYFPKERLARAISVYAGSQYLGAGFALVVGGAAIQLIAHFPPLELPFFGTFAIWQTTFLMVGLIGMVILIPMSFVKEPVRRGVAVSKAGKNQSVPFSEVWAFISANGVLFALVFIAFPIKGIVGFGTATWMPTYFIRVWDFDAHSIGYIFGGILGLCGAAGVYAGARCIERMSRTHADAYLRLSLFITPVHAILQIAVPFMPTAQSALAVLAVATFVSTFSLSGIMAAIQIITPNQMRGQMIAIYMFTANIMGTVGGPTSIALITDYVFEDEMMVGYSVSLAVAIIAPIAILMTWAGLKPFREALERAKSWSHATANTPA